MKNAFGYEDPKLNNTLAPLIDVGLNKAERRAVLRKRLYASLREFARTGGMPEEWKVLEMNMYAYQQSAQIRDPAEE